MHPQIKSSNICIFGIVTIGVHVVVIYCRTNDQVRGTTNNISTMSKVVAEHPQPIW